MRTFRNLLGTRITADATDVRISQWACYGAGLALFVLAILALPPISNRRGETALGLGAGLVAFQLMVLFGTLARQVHLASLRGVLGRRTGEYAAYAVGLTLLVGGIRELGRFELDRAGMTVGLLLILAACMATLSLGAATTLVRAMRIDPGNCAGGFGRTGLRVPGRPTNGSAPRR